MSYIFSPKAPTPPTPIPQEKAKSTAFVSSSPVSSAINQEKKRSGALSSFLGRDLNNITNMKRRNSLSNIIG